MPWRVRVWWARMPPSSVDEEATDEGEATRSDVEVLGRFYVDGNGIHDTHMGATKGFIHRPDDGSTDHNDIGSAQSEMTRAEAACGLAILAHEVCDEVEIFPSATMS